MSSERNRVNLFDLNFPPVSEDSSEADFDDVVVNEDPLPGLSAVEVFTPVLEGSIGINPHLVAVNEVAISSVSTIEVGSGSQSEIKPVNSFDLNLPPPSEDLVPVVVLSETQVVTPLLEDSTRVDPNDVGVDELLIPSLSASEVCVGTNIEVKRVNSFDLNLPAAAEEIVEIGVVIEDPMPVVDVSNTNLFDFNLPPLAEEAVETGLADVVNVIEESMPQPKFAVHVNAVLDSEIAPEIAEDQYVIPELQTATNLETGPYEINNSPVDSAPPRILPSRKIAKTYGRGLGLRPVVMKLVNWAKRKFLGG